MKSQKWFIDLFEKMYPATTLKNIHEDIDILSDEEIQHMADVIRGFFETILKPEKTHLILLRFESNYGEEEIADTMGCLEETIVGDIDDAIEALRCDDSFNNLAKEFLATIRGVVV